ncbi:MAG: hypothetical protein HQK55_04165 [Deltaproteobacteria bacterium]|nr:hypothetical protein [Deltaproteobacteria bacterium]
MNDIGQPLEKSQQPKFMTIKNEALKGAAAAGRIDASPKPVLRRLLLPLALIMILLMAGAGGAPVAAATATPGRKDRRRSC